MPRRQVSWSFGDRKGEPSLGECVYHFEPNV
jgi:hypothetical protein